MSKTKGANWAVSPMLVHPEWQWAWKGLLAAIPLTENGGQPVLYGKDGPMHGVSADDIPLWVATVGNVASQFSGTEDTPGGKAWNWPGYLPVLGTNDRTFFAAVIPTSGMLAAEGAIATWGGRLTEPNYDRWSVRTTSDAYLRIEIEGAGWSSTLPLIADKINCVSIRLEGTKIQDHILRVNGVEQTAVGTTTIATADGTDAGLLIGEGGRNDVPVWTNGEILVVHIWNYALSSRQLALLEADPFGPVRFARRIWVPVAGEPPAPGAGGPYYSTYYRRMIAA